MSPYPLILLVMCSLWGNFPLKAQPLRAAVFEQTHSWLNNCLGLKRQLGVAGFTTKDLDLTKSALNQGVDLIAFGTFASEQAAYQTYLASHAASLTSFVAGGGVLLQFAQADQTEKSPAFLPGTMTVTRCDDDFGPLLVKDPAHILLARLRLTTHQPPRLVLPYYLKRPGVWENFNGFGGMRVLMASDEGNSLPVFLEGQHGKGRFLLTSLYLDPIYDSTNKLVAPSGWQAAGAAFFKGVHTYVGQVQAGKAPTVVVTPPYKTPAPPPFVPGSFTLVVLPDTQHYSRLYSKHFYAQTDWIVANRQKLNIKYVLHLGDITNNNTTAQWAVAKGAVSRLDGNVPYALAPGNHDYGLNGKTVDRTTFLNTYFKLADCQRWPTFGGVFEAGRLDNSFHTFGGHGAEFLLLALEFGPRNKVLDWANQVVARHPDHRVILITHAYMYNDGAKYDWPLYGTNQGGNPHAYPTGSSAAGTNDGAEIYRKLVHNNPNFLLCLSGHVMGDGLAKITSRTAAGDGFCEMLVNYQMDFEGGEGFLRLLEFLPDGRNVQVKAYSPSKNQYATDPKNQFVIKLRAPLPVKGK